MKWYSKIYNYFNFGTSKNKHEYTNDKTTTGKHWHILQSIYLVSNEI